MSRSSEQIAYLLRLSAELKDGGVWKPTPLPTPAEAERAAERLRQAHVVPRPPGLVTPAYWRETRGNSWVAPIAYYCEYHGTIGHNTDRPETGWAFRADEACRYCIEGEP